MGLVVLAQVAGRSIDYWQVVTGGGPIVVGVLALLMVSSVLSWWVIFRKVLQIRAAERQTRAFLQVYDGSADVPALFAQIDTYRASPVANVFRAGYGELQKLLKRPTGDTFDGHENIERALRRAANVELESLEDQLSVLATTAAAAPFVGLFGTVWGIMGAFHDITAAGNASLPTVSGPISEALIATAVGLFAAIPAVVAYNQLAAQIRTLDNKMSNFSSDFLNLVKRQIS